MAAPRRRVMGPVLDDGDAGDDNKEQGPLPPPPAAAEGPAPPPRRRVMGPVLDDDEREDRKQEEVEAVYEGPTRPPGSSGNNNSSASSGNSSASSNNNSGRKRGIEAAGSAFVGPPRPGSGGQDDSEEEDEKVHAKRRADEWADVKHQEKATSVRREEWMTELPPERSSNATALLTNRQFSRKDNVSRRGDTSMWTDTPQDKQNKRQKGPTASMKEIAEQEFDNQKEEADQKFIEQHNKKYRAKSLAEIHQEEYKKKQAEIKDEDKPLWKPFDRSDMESRMATPQAAAKMIQNSHNLNERFGKASKRFL